jgi:hypothetical protein
MTKQSARNEKRVLGTAGLVMLNEVKHPCAGFLADARNDRKSMLGMTKKRARNDETECAE